MGVPFTRQSPTWEDGHTVLAEDAERWEQLGADAADWTSKSDYLLQNRSVLARRGMPANCWTRTGLWAATSGNWNLPGRLSLTVIVCAEQGRVLNAVRYQVDVAGSSDSVVRFGFYAVNPANWHPTGLPLFETTGPGNATGQHEIALSPTRGFPDGLPLIFAAVCQGTTAPQLPNQTSNVGAAGWYGTDANAAANSAYTSNSTSPGTFHVLNVPGALPNLTGVTPVASTGSPLVALRFA